MQVFSEHGAIFIRSTYFNQCNIWDYIRKKVVLGELKTIKDVEIYLNGLETEISYFKCLKLLKSMGFKTEKKEKISDYSHTQIKKAKLGQCS
jgi:hypothetical protein